MWVSAIELNGVRSFTKANIEFSKGLNIIVGPNNSGKSTILKAIYELQQRNLEINFKRKDAVVGALVLMLAGTDTKVGLHNVIGYGVDWQPNTNPYRYVIASNGSRQPENHMIFPATEPDNYIYPYFSSRKVTNYIEDINKNTAKSVHLTLSNLYSRIDRISNPRLPAHGMYMKLCEDILGIHITAVESDRGKKGAYIINDHDNIYLDTMGDGAPNILGLLINLCFAENKLFLIEEPENDIHPGALKKLLDVIADKSKSNQFIITTHSNVVVSHLGAREGAKVISLSMELQNKIPTTKVENVETSEDRIRVLGDLGYNLFDFNLPSAWLILEESSAERIIKDFLIPWFVPELNGYIRTVSAGSVTKVKAKFERLKDLFLYANLIEVYKNKAWVFVDCQKEGELDVISELKKTYKDWEEEHFLSFKECDFEKYYPENFAKEVELIFEEKDKEKRRSGKYVLINKVVEWCKANPDEAKKQLEKSAREIIDILKGIASKLDLR